jgi:MFS transporter, DHA2 family, multidrug resistance protein
MAIMYGIIQFIIQGSSHLYKFLGAHFAQIYDWRISLLLLNINFFLCIILTWIFLKKDVAPFKKPFQFDFRGWLLLILFLAVLMFLSAEGQNREWFSDPQILMAFAALLIISGIYVLYSRQASAPLIDLKVFRYKNVVLGTLFFFLIGMMNNTGSVIMGFMSGLLGFSDLYMARTHLFTGIGLLISIPICTYLLFHRVYLRITAIVGFLSFTIFHVLMYFRFYPGITESDFILPLIFKGMGVGFLYVLSSLYISENIPKHLSTSRMMSGILARNVLAILLGAAVLNTFVAKLTVQHKTGIGQQLTTQNQPAALQYKNTQNYYMAKGMSSAEAEKMAHKSLQKEMSQSATLLAYKDIYLLMTIISFVPILLILLLGIGKRPVQSIQVEPIPI